MLKRMFFAAMLAFCAGCSAFYQKTEDVSSKYKEFIGKTIVLKEDMLIVSWMWGMETQIKTPGYPGHIPSMKEYKEDGKTWVGLFPDYRVTGLAEAGEKFKILSIEEVVGYYDHGLMFMYLLREKDGKTYQSPEGNLFYGDDYGDPFKLSGAVSLAPEP